MVDVKRGDTNISQAVEFVTQVYNHVMRVPGMSWRRINPAVAGALDLAIEAAMKFDTNDFAFLSKTLRGGYWMGAEHERFFGRAVLYENLTACKSYEAWRGRKAFIYRDGKRLYVGKQFKWTPLRMYLTVTSFCDDGTSLIACSYSNDAARKIERRITITLEDLKADYDHANDEKAVNDLCSDYPHLVTDDVRARVIANLGSIKDFGPSQWKVAAQRVREIVKEWDTPDPSITLSEDQAALLLQALRISRPFKKSDIAHQNHAYFRDDHPVADIWRSLADIGCAVICAAGSAMVTDRGVRALGATRFIGSRVDIPQATARAEAQP